MDLDEMAKKVGTVRLALLAARAQRDADRYNRHPGVDQGGQYVYTTASTELRRLLEEAMKEME